MNTPSRKQSPSMTWPDLFIQFLIVGASAFFAAVLMISASQHASDGWGWLVLTVIIWPISFLIFYLFLAIAPVAIGRLFVRVPPQSKPPKEQHEKSTSG
ncbi:MAG: hypothetical protein P4N60_10535 [Verrucomicrobiae bacterium]|nr:hypothetical protein [Verrucomicrobiae bacterium]